MTKKFALYCDLLTAILYICPIKYNMIAMKYLGNLSLAVLFSAMCWVANAQTNDWENPSVVGVNKENYHATLMLPSEKATCEECVSLDGVWKFKWSPDPQSRP